MYHSISEPTARSSHPYFEIRTSTSAFREQMQFLHDAGITTLLPSEIKTWFNSPLPNTNRAVCLTFDDAYEDFYTSAFPVLQKFDFKSTVYVPTGLVGEKKLNDRKILNWEQIKELSEAGVHFGSHAVMHLDMRSLSDTQLKNELAHSKNSLEDALGKPVHDFSHPFAFPEHNRSYKDNYRKQLQACGYHTAMTTIIGCARKTLDPLLIPRLPINGYDDNRLLTAKLNSAYDWLHRAQFISKMVSNRFIP